MNLWKTLLLVISNEEGKSWKVYSDERVNFPFPLPPSARHSLSEKGKKFLCSHKAFIPQKHKFMFFTSPSLHRRAERRAKRKIIDFSSAIHFLIRTWSAFFRWNYVKPWGEARTILCAEGKSIKKRKWNFCFSHSLRPRSQMRKMITLANNSMRLWYYTISRKGGKIFKSDKLQSLEKWKYMTRCETMGETIRA